MKIHEVQENLKRTIAGKEHMLDSHKRFLRSIGTSGPEGIACSTTIQFLEININELERILKDVQACISAQEQLEEQGWQG